jgi:hypothetical protein
VRVRHKMAGGHDRACLCPSLGPFASTQVTSSALLFVRPEATQAFEAPASDMWPMAARCLAGALTGPVLSPRSAESQGVAFALVLKALLIALDGECTSTAAAFDRNTIEPETLLRNHRCSAAVDLWRRLLGVPVVRGRRRRLESTRN